MTRHTAINVGHCQQAERAYPLGSKAGIPNRLYWCTLSKNGDRQKKAEYHHRDNAEPENEFLPGLGVRTPNEMAGEKSRHTIWQR